jgi:hypothetical protein
MSWFKLVGSIFKPAAELIDNLHTSDHEKLQIKQAMFELQVEAFNKAEEYETQLLDAKKTIITAEAQSQSMIARNWRPITMLTFLVLVVLDAFKWLPSPLAPEAWLLLQIGLGGYVAGRSVEKGIQAYRAPKYEVDPK